MIYLGDEICFSFPPSIVEECLEFAAKKAPHNTYLHEKRNADLSRTFCQDSYSKLAEFAARDFLFLFGKTYEVDLNIYAPRDKGWAADLGNIGVKSTTLNMCDYIYRHTGSKESWTFQFSNNDGRGGVDQGVFGLSDEERKEKCCIFTTVEHEQITEKTRVWIRACLTYHDLFRHNLFKDPIKKSLIGIKKTIYDGDLKELKRRKSVRK